MRLRGQNKGKEPVTDRIQRIQKDGHRVTGYEMTLAALKLTLEQSYPGFSALADGSLVASRQSPALREMMRKQFDEPLEKFLEQVSQAESDEAVEKLLLAMPVKSNFLN